MNKRKSLFLAALFAISLAAGCKKKDKTSSTGTNEPSSSTEVEASFTAARITMGTTDGTIRLEASATKGTIYYAVKLTANVVTALTATEIVAGETTANVVKSGNSGTASSIDIVLSGLEQGKEHTAYFVIKDGSTYSSIRNSSCLANVTRDYGAGTLADPYKIYDELDLSYMGSKASHPITETSWGIANYYELANDIDLSEEKWTPLGADTDGSRFTGVFDGKNHKIIGMNISISENINNIKAGFFSALDGATIKNVTFENAYVDSSMIASTSFDTGIITGYAKGGATIENIAILGSAVNATNSTRVGGVAGRASGATISSSYIEAEVRGSSRTAGLVGQAVPDTDYSVNLTNNIFVGSVVGLESTSNIGGIVGYVQNKVLIKNNISFAFINSVGSAIGGIAGHVQHNNTSATLRPEVKNNIFLGTVETDANVTDVTETINYIIGNVSTANSGVDMENNYYLSDSSRPSAIILADNAKGTGQELTDETKLVDTTWLGANNFDLTDIWEIKSDASRITLKNNELDNGEVAEPFAVVSTIATAAEEKKATIRIKTNDEDAKINYIVSGTKLNATADIINEQADSSLSKAVNQISVNETFTAGDFGQYLYGYYSIVGVEGNSKIYQVNGTSRNQTELTITLGVTSGSLVGGLNVSAKTNLNNAEIWYVVSSANTVYSIAQIKSATVTGDIVKVKHITENSSSEDLETYELTADQTYYVSAYAELPDRISTIKTANAMAKSASAPAFEDFGLNVGEAITTSTQICLDGTIIACANGKNVNIGEIVNGFTIGGEKWAVHDNNASVYNGVTYSRGLRSTGAGRTITFTVEGSATLTIIGRAYHATNSVTGVLSGILSGEGAGTFEPENLVLTGKGTTDYNKDNTQDADKLTISLAAGTYTITAPSTFIVNYIGIAY